MEGTKGGTPLTFLIGGLVELLTAYSYIPLPFSGTPDPAETYADVLRIAFGRGLFAASINILLDPELRLRS